MYSYTYSAKKTSRLSQGNDHGVQSTDTIDLFFRSKVPNNFSVSYASFACDYKPIKSEPYRVRCVDGGDKLDYIYDP